MHLTRLARYLRPYKGAGIVFWTTDTEDHTRVLLGKRLYRPFAGYWTIPGGGMEEADQGDFRTCAARETFEETVGIAKLISVKELIRQQLQHAPEHRLHVPAAFDFRSFLVPLVSAPDLRIWPNRYHSHNEFAAFAWFEHDKLPKALHPGIRAAIAHLVAPTRRICLPNDSLAPTR